MITYLSLGKRNIPLNFKTVEVKKNARGKFDVTVIFDDEDGTESLIILMGHEDTMSLGESLINAAHAVKTGKEYSSKVQL